MLRAITSANAINTVKYFVGDLAAGEYYLDGAGRSEWLGKGADLLGLKGSVDRKTFKALCENRHPETGEQLTPRMKADRRVGVDFNFHVPKSVSLVGEVGGDKAIFDAVWMSVAMTMRAMEPWVETRVREDGANTDRRTGNLVWAQFLHETTRPVDGIPDPHIHVHCFVPNATYDQTEGRWKACQCGRVREHMPFFEAMFLSTLARRVEALGYAIRKTATAWEIAGISPNTLALYCRRTAEIEAATAARGVTDPAEKAKYGAYTRRPKSESLPMEAVKRDWVERLSVDERHNLTRLKGQTREFSTERALSEAVRYAVAKTFERSAVVKESALLAEILRACPGQMTVETARAEYNRHGIVVRELKGDRLVTTNDVLKEEKRLVDLARNGRGQLPRLAANRSFDLPGLDDQERAAIWGVLQSADLVTVMHTRGTGQAKVLVRTMGELCASELKRPLTVVSATGVGGRGDVRDAGFKDVVTVAQLLSSPKLQKELPRSVLWVSDAHKLSTKAAADLIELAAARGARVILAADKGSRGAIFRGNTIQALERHAGVVASTVDTVRRQKGDYADAVSALNRGDLWKGVQALDRMGAVRQTTTHSLFTEASKEFLKTFSTRTRSLVIAPTRAAVKEVTVSVRSALRDAGKLKKDRDLTHLSRKDLSAIDKARSAIYKPGDVIEFTKKCGRFSTRERWTVTGTNLLGYVEIRKGLKALSTLPLRHAESFDVFEKQSIAVAVGDVIRMTKTVRTRAVVDIALGVVSKKHAKPTRILQSGSLHRVREFTLRGHLVLDNGFILPKNSGHFDYGYAATSASSVPHGIEHVVVVQPKNAGHAASIEQLARSVGMGTRSATVFTDLKSLNELVSRREEPRVGLDLTGGEFERTGGELVSDALERAAKHFFGVKPPSRELERALER